MYALKNLSLDLSTVFLFLYNFYYTENNMLCCKISAVLKNLLTWFELNKIKWNKCIGICPQKPFFGPINILFLYDFQYTENNLKNSKYVICCSHLIEITGVKRLSMTT